MHGPHREAPTPASQRLSLALGLALVASPAAFAQTPVDAAGDDYAFAPVEAPDEGARIETLGDDAIPLLPARELEDLVGPVALYPDKLLAIVLPAAAYPLQIVQAARFLEALEDDPTLTPSPDWDEAVVALLNYPEVLAQLNDDVDWTLRLGEAVIAQQADVLSAVQRFRDRAYFAGNLESDERQTVRREDEIIEIEPVDETTIYVPYYRPETVVQHSVRPVYSYYPEPYPVYYYPYSDGHAFRRGYFWGVTSAYALGWRHSRLSVLHHSFSGHPYFGYHYGWNWWYRRPTLVYHNNLYYRPSAARRPVARTRAGDYWVPRYTRRQPWSGDRRARTLTTRTPPSTAYPVEARSRGYNPRPSIGGVARGLREQGAERRASVRPPSRTTPSAPPGARSGVDRSPPSPNRSRSYTTRQPAPKTYQRREPYRAPVQAPKYSTRPSPVTPSGGSRRPSQPAPVAPPSSNSRQAPSGRSSPNRESRSRTTTRRFER